MEGIPERLFPYDYELGPDCEGYEFYHIDRDNDSEMDAIEALRYLYREMVCHVDRTHEIKELDQMHADLDKLELNKGIKTYSQGLKRTIRDLQRHMVREMIKGGCQCAPIVPGV